MLDEARKMKKVLIPVQSKDGKKTYWIGAGRAFMNRDASINVYLDCLPVDGKLQIREWDEPRREAGAPLRSSSDLGLEAGQDELTF